MSEPKVLGEVIGDAMEKMDAPADVIAGIRAAAQRHSLPQRHCPPHATACVVLVQKEGDPSVWIAKDLARPFRMERVVLTLKVARAALTGSEWLEQIMVGKTAVLAAPLPLRVVAGPTDEIKSRLTQQELELAAEGPTQRWLEVAAEVDAEVGAMLGALIGGEDWAEKGDSIEFHFDPASALQIENMALFGAAVVKES